MTLLADLAAEVHDYRGRRYPVANWPEFRERDVPHMKGYLGFHTFTTLGRHPLRYADARAKCKIAGVEYAAMSELELRSPYIDACNGEKRAAKWGGPDEDGLAEISGLEIPHYCKGGQPVTPVVGFDMDHSYWQFVSHFSTQVEYRPTSGAWAGVGAPWRDLETLYPLKMMRSAICTASWRNKTATWAHEGEEHQTRSPYYQPQAWRLLSDILMSWAQETVALFDPWAIVVDCVVLEPEKVEDYQDFLADRWGATAHLERSWEPGKAWQWPLAKSRQDNLRPIGDLIRQRLAWTLTDQGPTDAPLLAERVGDELVLTPQDPEPEPPPAPWQAKRGLSRWELLHIELPEHKEHEPHLSKRHPRCAQADPTGTVQIWVLSERGPPRQISVAEACEITAGRPPVVFDDDDDDWMPPAPKRKKAKALA